MTEQRDPKLSLTFESVLTLFRSGAENFLFWVFSYAGLTKSGAKDAKRSHGKTFPGIFFLLKPFNWGKIPQTQHKNW
jgi:hypothetical protein